MLSITTIYILKLCLVMYVSARSVSVESSEEVSMVNVPAHGPQRDYLANAVCQSLEYLIKDEEIMQKCIRDFSWDMDSDRSGFRMSCRSNGTVTFEVPRSELFRLVLLLPEPNLPDEIYSISYEIVDSEMKYVQLDIEPRKNYTVYSTILDKNFMTSKWHQEAVVSAWTAPPQKDYGIQLTFLNAENYTDELFTWKSSGGFDSCFQLQIKCSSSDYLLFDIWPDSPPNKTVKKLPLNDFCYVDVTGMYGTTKYEFKTPSLDAIERPHFTFPEKVTIEAKEDDYGGWTVRVAWSSLSLKPDTFNVTLRTRSHNTTLVVPGDATEATFRDIIGEGTYSVSIYALLGARLAHTSRRAIFPGRQTSTMGALGWRWVGVAGLAWGAVGVGMLAAAVYWLRLRKRDIPPMKPHVHTQVIETKPLEDSCPEPPVKIESSSDRWEMKPEHLLLYEIIGEGAFGVVRRGTLAPTGKEVAVKTLKEFPTLDEMRAFHVEMDLMKSVGAHAHVVSLVGCCSGAQPCLVAEYCSQGDLLSFLRRSWDVIISKRSAKYYNNNIDTYSNDYRNDLFTCQIPQENSKLVVNKMYDLEGVCETELTSRDLLSFCRQIAMGMEFLASNRLVHRDLAARNVLVTGDKTLKIADFGLSRDIYEENQYKQKGNGKMPVKWMALESLTRRIYTTQSDVWSFGVVMWEVATVGGSPYPDVPASRLPRLLRTGYRMPRPVNCSRQLYSLMLSCWREAPRDRPTFAELHARLDDLLQRAAAGTYLSLELDDTPPPEPAPKHRYFRMIIRAKRNWARGESYERPLKAPRNHYTSPPVTLAKSPI